MAIHVTHLTNARRPGKRAAVFVSLGAALAVTAGCGDAPQPTTGASAASSLPAAAQPTSQVLADSDCQATPPSGPIDHLGYDLKFSAGQVRVAVSTTPSSLPVPAPAVPPPAAGQSAASSAAPSSSASSGAPGSRCYGFSRWGNADPSVPPDSLLFAFKGSSSDGARISFFVGDLTRAPRRAPMPAIAAEVGVSIDGDYYQSAQCTLQLTAMSAQRGAGYFHCPGAVEASANPFAPSDDVPYDSDASPAPTTSAPRTAMLSGWFTVTP